MEPKKVFIVGGGFGGLSCAKKFAKKKDFAVTLMGSHASRQTSHDGFSRLDHVARRSYLFLDWLSKPLFRIVRVGLGLFDIPSGRPIDCGPARKNSSAGKMTRSGSDWESITGIEQRPNGIDCISMNEVKNGLITKVWLTPY